MEEFKDKKTKLIGLKKQILSMPNNMVKANKIEGYTHLLCYLKEIGQINYSEYEDYDIDDIFTGKYDRYVVNSTQKKIDELTQLSPYLFVKYNRLIDEYKKNGFCSFEFSVDGKVNKKEMNEYFEEFLNILGDDVCKLYNNMVRGNNIYLMPGLDCLGFSVNSMTVDNPCIVIDNIEHYFDFYVTLIHELGHCYQFYLQRNHTHLESFNPFMETTSIFLEKLFCVYLQNKKRYQSTLKDYELEEHIYFLNDISICKALCGLIMNGKISNINAYDLSYDSLVSEKKLRKSVLNDCGYIMPNKLNMSFTEFHYSLGNIIANYFINKLPNGFDKTWKEYKDFICMVDNYPLKEILDECFNLNLMQNNIKTFIKSYRSR